MKPSKNRTLNLARVMLLGGLLLQGAVLLEGYGLIQQAPESLSNINVTDECSPLEIPAGDWEYKYTLKNIGTVPVSVPFNRLIFTVSQHPSHLIHHELVTRASGAVFQSNFPWSGSGGSTLSPQPNFSNNNYTWLGLLPNPLPPGATIIVSFTDPDPPATAPAAIAQDTTGPLKDNFLILPKKVCVPAARGTKSIPTLDPVTAGDTVISGQYVNQSQPYIGAKVNGKLQAAMVTSDENGAYQLLLNRPAVAGNTIAISTYVKVGNEYKTMWCCTVIEVIPNKKGTENLDPDGDGVFGKDDYCPNLPGKPETNGC